MTDGVGMIVHKKLFTRRVAGILGQSSVELLYLYFPSFSLDEVGIGFVWRGGTLLLSSG